jgi:hypothetical protein
LKSDDRSYIAAVLSILALNLSASAEAIWAG